jgi:predicted aldo/keto reductase-like oxidoreductase
MNKNYLGSDIKKLGFGLMRLPQKDGQIDLEQLKQMVDLFLEKGFTYFDTAYPYHGGESEVATREALVKRHPRESYQLATKLPVWEVKEKADLQRLFNIQLERTAAGYFDFYLLHALGKDRLESLDKFDMWGFVAELKAKGLVRHIGFSFHDTADVLDEILTKHPEMEFVQLQINYADWEAKGVQSRLCYEVALKHNKPIIVMEPVKGGRLAGMSPAVEPS